jgi:hypothetical protein
MGDLSSFTRYQSHRNDLLLSVEMSLTPDYCAVSLLVLDFLKLSEMQTEQYSAKQFSRDVDANIRKYEDESEVLRHVKPLLGRLIRTPGSVPAEASSGFPRESFP